MRTALHILIFFLLVSPAARSAIFHFTEDQMSEVTKIAREISMVQPTLSEAKYIEYAVSIYRAANQYHIDPHVLISIAQQESSFREGLPEGRAGEIGICQIRKLWVKNPKFRSEFPNVKERDLHDPSKNFMFAAWILHDLRKNNKTAGIPYWSYYNAVRFNNRFKYFVAVNRHLSTIKKGAPSQKRYAKEQRDSWSPDATVYRAESGTLPGQPKRAAAIGTPTMSDNTELVPSAFRKNSRKPASMMMKAASELNIPNLFGSLPVVD